MAEFGEVDIDLINSRFYTDKASGLLLNFGLTRVDVSKHCILAKVHSAHAGAVSAFLTIHGIKFKSFPNGYFMLDKDDVAEVCKKFLNLSKNDQTYMIGVEKGHPQVAYNESLRDYFYIILGVSHGAQL